MSRPSNQELCSAYRKVLTEGAREQLSGQSTVLGTDLLTATKEWRNQLWKQFKELENRLCPTPSNTK